MIITNSKEQSLIFPRRIPSRYSKPGGEKSKRVYIVIITVIISVAILSMSFESGPAFASPAIPVHHQTPWNYVIPIWLNRTVYIYAQSPVSFTDPPVIIPSLTMIIFSNYRSGSFIEIVFIHGTNLSLTLGLVLSNNVHLYLSVPSGVTLDLGYVYVSAVFIHVLGNSTHNTAGGW